MRYVSRPVEVDVVELTFDFESTQAKLLKYTTHFRGVRPYRRDDKPRELMYDIETVKGFKRAAVGDFVLFKEGSQPVIMTAVELHAHFKPVAEVPVLHVVPKRLEDWLGKRQRRTTNTIVFKPIKYIKMEDLNESPS